MKCSTCAGSGKTQRRSSLGNYFDVGCIKCGGTGAAKEETVLRKLRKIHFELATMVLVDDESDLARRVKNVMLALDNEIGREAVPGHAGEPA